MDMDWIWILAYPIRNPYPIRPERADIRSDPIISDLILPDTNTHIYNIVHFRVLVLSTIEAEYITIIEGCKPALWMRKFLEELGL